MNYPANYVHALAAVPLFTIFTTTCIRSYLKTHNRVTLYLGIMAFFYAGALFMSILPVVLGSHTLLVCMLVSSFFDLAGGVMMWVLVAHIYGAKSNIVRGIIIAISVSLALAAIMVVFRDVAQMPPAFVDQGGLTILYSPTSRQYTTLLTLQYTGSSLLAWAFWRQSNSASTARDKVRLRILSVMFVLVLVILGFMPFSEKGNSVVTVAQSIQLSVAFLLLGVFMAITFFVHPNKKLGVN